MLYESFNEQGQLIQDLMMSITLNRAATNTTILPNDRKTIEAIQEVLANVEEALPPFELPNASEKANQKGKPF